MRNKLLILMAFLLIVGVGGYLLIRLFVPLLAPAAPILALFLVVRMLSSKEVSRTIRALGKGYLGEMTVGKHLEQLPTGWRVFHDLDLGGENVDHLVIGPAGIFNVEVKNYSGKVIATPRGLYNKGQRQDEVVKQAWRQSHRLREIFGVEVKPILVFVGDQLEGDRVGKLPVKRPDELLSYFKGLPKVWEYAEFIAVVRKAEQLVK
ncbi:nuclease-related domain-containing protein [Meiothermus sp. PNK-Is4]|uniref:nuclease-related domain-containing protein n=1 Tax=Meiothermus sp. PNK-Is4 TaxID=2740565 RepID=UPI0020C442F6|nr:nuclease-related domain-containing protein [Meiothermus sp. PNK-Is4]